MMMVVSRVVNLLKQRGFMAAMLLLGLSLSLEAQQWRPLGPDGGDVRSLARDPHSSDRILLGTSDGQIFESLDNGTKWSRFARLGQGNDYVLDTILFDPDRQGVIFVAAWSIETKGGDLFRSNDNGRTWKALSGMRDKSIRALSIAPSDSRTLVAGALDGVYRSDDSGDHWARISPENHDELRNFESIAIDPLNPNVVYAGTWHLPWKTSDGGQSWQNIKHGIIDDSDIFSIIIDPHSPSVVYASACSGIYKSESAGDLFHKVQGIPASARRTRVLRQDAINPNIVFAGTTEGLWKTVDAGKTWIRMTAPNVIVNDVLVDARDSSRVLLATDRGGVLASKNGGRSFIASNRGFAHRQVAAVLVDRDISSTVYAGLINDKEFGGVFVTRDAGASWQQQSSGLKGRDVFTLRQTVKGELLAGTNRGIYAYRAPAKGQLPQWVPINNLVEVREAIAPPVKKYSMAKVAPVRRIVKSELKSRVNELELTGDRWLAATSSGIYVSKDEGRSWNGGPVLNESDFIGLKATPQMVVAAARRAVVISLDGGTTWFGSKLPPEITALTGIAMDDKSNIFLAAREGAYRSQNGGETWEHLHRLPVNHLTSIVYDSEDQRLLTTSRSSTEVFESFDSGRNWRRVDSGWLLRTLRSARGRIVAATAFDGIVLQPEQTAGFATFSEGGTVHGSQK